MPGEARGGEEEDLSFQVTPETWGASTEQFEVLMLIVCCCQKTLASDDCTHILAGPRGDEHSAVFLKWDPRSLMCSLLSRNAW